MFADHRELVASPATRKCWEKVINRRESRQSQIASPPTLSHLGGGEILKKNRPQQELDLQSRFCLRGEE